MDKLRISAKGQRLQSSVIDSHKSHIDEVIIKSLKPTIDLDEQKFTLSVNFNTIFIRGYYGQSNEYYISTIEYYMPRGLTGHNGFLCITERHMLASLTQLNELMNLLLLPLYKDHAVPGLVPPSKAFWIFGEYPLHYDDKTGKLRRAFKNIRVPYMQCEAEEVSGRKDFDNAVLETIRYKGASLEIILYLKALQLIQRSSNKEKSKKWTVPDEQKALLRIETRLNDYKLLDAFGGGGKDEYNNGVRLLTFTAASWYQAHRHTMQKVRGVYNDLRPVPDLKAHELVLAKKVISSKGPVTVREVIEEIPSDGRGCARTLRDLSSRLEDYVASQSGVSFDSMLPEQGPLPALHVTPQVVKPNGEHRNVGISADTHSYDERIKDAYSKVSFRPGRPTPSSTGLPGNLQTIY